MNVVDSSGWLEYLADATNARFFARALEATAELIVPTVSLYEVFKHVLLQRDEHAALRAVALMQQGQVVTLTSPVALSAARLSIDLRLPMGDSIMLATARAHRAMFWTQDSDFAGVDGVKYIAKKGSR